MPEEQKRNESISEQERVIQQRILPWRLWVSVLLSAFLIVTFGWYLPMRFQYNALTDTHDMTMQDNAMMGKGHDGHGANQYHDAKDIRDGLSIDLSVFPMPVLVSTSTRFDFFVNQKPERKPILTQNLEIEHTKYMHVIGVREDMNEFFHLHPQDEWASHYGADEYAGHWSVDYQLRKPGRYKIWSEVKKDGVNYTVGQEPIEVDSYGVRFEKQVSFDRMVNIDNYQVILNAENVIIQGENIPLSFEIHTQNGREVETEEYLGAPMHLTIIKDDWTQFIHTHPDSGMDMQNTHSLLHLISVANAHGGEEKAATDTAHGIEFHVNLPEAGVYKAFANFRPKGIDLPPNESLTASFWINVENKAPITGQKTVLLIVSLMLMAILSWIVKKMLVVSGI